MTILDGNKLSQKIIDELAEEIKEKKLNLNLAVVLVGQSLISKSYISKKREASEKIGIKFSFHEFSDEVSQSNMEREVKRLVEEKDVSGIVIQLPLPKDIRLDDILNLVPYNKDPDMLSKDSFDKFQNKESEILPPVVSGIKKLLEEYKIDILNKNIVVVGKGRLVGKPLSVWLKNMGAKFEILDRKTEDISAYTKKADIIISGAGSIGIIKDDMIKEGAVLIDAGTSSEGGEIKGDIDKSAYDKASFVAPVPGGVGPMTVACLLDNLVKLNNG
ncbi:MAG: bifunctional 5,10-methylenetetrahydrofolate dehydrogenase/5,10-methenyltetrahydrofolate cyclohydrolase [Candidatus Nealsonbacteria bacterium]|nr:bifunctional 5,10-methylenetetrahydrofolate dehydrogenase/5,10-methenyltetrahydrofolate cyclohydrolase [Candidatus Nealsonbacteria bacterium]